MMGVTFFPTTSYIHTPVIQALTTDAPSKIPENTEWLYKNLPCLDITNSFTITPESATRMYINCHFKSSGEITHISPQLLNYLGQCYDMIRFQTTKPDLNRIYVTIAPPQPKTIVRSRTDVGSVKKLITPANDWDCCCSWHSHSTISTTMHKDALEATRHNVCTSCYHKMFEKAPNGWFPLFSIEKLLCVPFYNDVIKPLFGKPLGRILRGSVYLQDMRVVSAKDAEIASRELDIATPLWALRQLTKETKHMELWPKVSNPKYSNTLRSIGQASKKTGKKLPAYCRVLKEHIDKLVVNGKVALDKSLKLQNVQYVIKNNPYKKQDKIPFYIGTETLFFYGANKRIEENSILMSRACAMVHQQMIYNDPPIKINIKLVNTQQTAVRQAFHPNHLPLNPLKLPEVTVQNSELLTWEKLYHILSFTRCHSITLCGSYARAAMGDISTPVGRLPVGGCFCYIVDLAHTFLHTRTTPTERYKCKFNLLKLDAEHRATSDHLHARSVSEESIYNTSSWLQQHNIHQESIDVKILARHIPHAAVTGRGRIA